MNGEYRRREVLSIAGSTSLVALAGCSGADNAQPTPTTDSSPGDSGGTPANDEGDGGTDQTNSNAVYDDDHMRITTTDDGYRLVVPGWPDDYVGTAEHRHISPEGSTSTYPVQYDPAGSDGRSMSSPQYHIVTPGFHADSFVVPFVWGDEFFSVDTPQLDVWYVPAGEDVYGREIVFRDDMPSDSYTRIEDTPFTVAHIDPTQFGWTNDPESGEELWVHLVGQEQVEEVDLSYTWGGGDSPTSTDASIEEGVPPEDADPATLLPSVPDGWEQTGDGPVASAGPIEAGHWGNYTSPADVQYNVEIARFESADAAASAPSEWNLYDDKPVYVTRGNFGFAGGGVTGGGEVDVDKVVTLLGHSPALSEEYVRNNNMNQ